MRTQLEIMALTMSNLSFEVLWKWMVFFFYVMWLETYPDKYIEFAVTIVVHHVCTFLIP